MNFNTIDLNEKYKKNNYVIIDNAFDLNLMNNVYSIISNKIFNKLWYLTIFNGNKKYIFPYPYKNRNINTVLKKLKKKRKNNIFTYFLYRTFVYPKNIYLNKIFTILSSENFINKVKEITDINISKISEIFISKYDKNCFLDIHEDENKGKVAFVLQLSKKFKINDGGALFLLNDDLSIKKYLVPKFNTFLLFTVNSQSKHFVSSINNYTDKKRYAITGWFI